MFRNRTQVALIAAVTTSAMLANLSANAYPSDVFTSPSAVPTPQPGKDQSPSFASDRVDGSGAATLSVPIPTAPNRAGHVPRHALTYSSKSPIRGGIAMGWELDLPRIELDTSHGRVQDVRYRASEGGRLIEVDEPTEAGWTAYRGDEDASFTRYERNHTVWRARRTDGSVLYFGETDESRDMNHAYSDFFASEGRWFVTRAVDKFGNQIEYEYDQVMGNAPEGTAIPVDIAVRSISYGKNDTAGLSHHTTIWFDYAPQLDLCSVGNVPIGAQMDFRTGIMTYRGAARLDRIRMETRDKFGMAERRRLDLDYDKTELACQVGVAHAPLRVLTSVRETAFAVDGTPTVMPAQTFEYNRLERSFDAQRSAVGALGGGRGGSELPNGGKNRDATDVQATDLDGDGRLDRLRSGELSADNRCTITWERGTDSGFEPPSLAVGSGTLLGLPWSNGAAPSGREICSVSHQLASVFNVTGGTACNPNIPDETGTSPDSQMKFQFRDWNHDGLVDLIMTAEGRRNAYRPELDASLAPDPTCSPPPATGGNCDRREEYACGSYVSRVAYNQGGGSFSAPELLLLPIPMDPEQGWNGATRQALVDLDGDGWEDVVKLTNDAAMTWNQLLVHRSHRDGTFGTSTPYPLPLIDGYDYDPISQEDVWGPLSLAPSVVRTESGELSYTVYPMPNPDDDVEKTLDVGSTATMRGEFRDLNGDGLQDYVFARGTGVRVLYNTGDQFLQEPGVPAGSRGHLVLDATQPEALDRTVTGRQVHVISGEGPHGEPVVGGRWFTRNTLRAVDFDEDGLVDLVRLPEPLVSDAGDPTLWTQFEPEIGEGEAAELFINLGNRFISVGNSPALDRAKHGLAHRIEGNRNQFGKPWHVKSDYVDIDGDGMPEAVDSMTARYDANDQPLRHLRAVHNGRGGHTEYHYRAVVGEGVPRPVWVVDSTTSWADAGAEQRDPMMVTAYDYSEPVVGPDPDGDYEFRGFGRTEVTLPSGAVRAITNDHSQSYRGLLSKEEVFDGAGNLVSLTKHQYEVRKLFDADSHPGEVTTFHPIREESRTCRTGQSYAQCESNGELRAVERGFWTFAPVGGGPSARHMLKWERTGPTFGAVPGNKLAWHMPEYSSTATVYLNHPAGERSLVYDGPNVVRDVSASWHYYDASKRCEFWTARPVGNGGLHVTTHVCDLSTGNLIYELSPRFYSSYGPGVTHQFDLDKRFSIRTTNELGHATHFTWDAATGTKLSERGPNAETVNGTTVRAGWEVDVDGLGRELRRRVYVDDASLGYRAEEVSRSAYLDPVGQPSTVSSERRIHLGGATWANTATVSDGLGRVILERVYEGASLRAETRKFYGSDGTVTRVKVPRPSATSALDFVEWQYAYDSLGRMIEAREPTHPGCSGAIGTAGACGKRWTYNGRMSTENDATGTLGGAVGATRSVVDAFGRLSRVEEQTDDGSWAATHYEFDGNDNVSRVTNADGVITLMEHDMLGRRTAVTRGPNKWKFGYDLNGNLVTVVSPVPAGAAQADYTTTLAYDQLNRETLRTPAKRDWTPVEDDVFGSGVVTSTYDLGPNGIGRLSSVQTNWGGPDHHRIDYTYEGRGLTTQESHEFSLLNGVYSDQRTLQRTYTAQGLVASATEADGDIPAASTAFATGYDGRGLPSHVDWAGGGTVQSVLRTADGRMYKRFWSAPGAVDITGETAFDDLGRIASLSAKAQTYGATPTKHGVEQWYSFDGAGDVTHIDTGLSLASAPAEMIPAIYGYDAMHRVIAASGDRGYQATFGYSPGGRIAHATVTADPSAVRVRARDVGYHYASDVPGSLADPDAPVVLAHEGQPGNFMQIDYDRAGNATTRGVDKDSYQHVYDGLDRQREVTAPDGSRELHFYGADGMRALIVTADPSDDVQRIRWTLGGTEIWYDGGGGVEKTIATTAIDGAAVRIVDQDHREFVFQDPRSHMIATFSETGALLAGFTYGPYGELLREYGSETGEHLRRFNGKEWDETSGLSYYGYRYYDEASLTWTQADPKYRWAVDNNLLEPRRAALYAFSNGNPVSLVDPDGHDAKNLRMQRCDASTPDASQSGVVPLVPPVGPRLTTEAPQVIYENSGGPLARLIRPSSGDLSAAQRSALADNQKFIQTRETLANGDLRMLESSIVATIAYHDAKVFGASDKDAMSVARMAGGMSGVTGVSGLVAVNQTARTGVSNGLGFIGPPGIPGRDLRATHYKQPNQSRQGWSQKMEYGKSYRQQPAVVTEMPPVQGLQLFRLLGVRL